MKNIRNKENQANIKIKNGWYFFTPIQEKKLNLFCIKTPKNKTSVQLPKKLSPLRNVERHGLHIFKKCFKRLGTTAQWQSQQQQQQ